MEDLIAPSANSVPIDVNINNFQKEVIEESTKTPVVVQFWASWCGPCKQLGPVLEKVVASEKGNVRLAKVDIDKNQQIAAQMRVQSVPTVYGFFNGQPVDGFAGVQPESSVKQFVKKLVSLMGNEPDINAILESATNLLESQDFDSAFAEFQEILSADPESIEGIAGMVRCLVGKRDLSAAREIVDQLDEEFRSKPAMEVAITALELAVKGADAAKSLDGAREAVNRDQNDLQARFDLAMALFSLGDEADAMEHLLYSIGVDRNWNNDAARTQLLEFFKTLGPTNPNVIHARRQLSTMLFS